MPRPRSARPADAAPSSSPQRLAYGHHARVFDVALAPATAPSHPGWLASAGEDDAVRVWAPTPDDPNADYRQAAASRVHGEPVLRVTWSAAGDALATAGGDRAARVWRFEGGEDDGLTSVATLGPASEEGYACEFVDGTRTLVTTDGAALVAWDVATATRLPSVGPPPQPTGGAPADLVNPRWAEAHVFGAAVGGGSGLAAAACSDGCVRVWTVGADGALSPAAARRVFAGVASAITWLEDGVTLAVGGPAGAVAAFDVRAGADAPPLWTANLSGPAHALAALPSNALAVATAAGTVAVLGGGDGGVVEAMVEARVPAPRSLMCVASDGAGAVAASGEGVGDGERVGAPARGSLWAPVTVF